MKQNTLMQFEFDEEITKENDTVLLTFGLSNLFYFITMLFGSILPMGIMISIVASESTLVVITILTKLAFTRCGDNWKSVTTLLSFYPTQRWSIRISRYRILLRYMILELFITGIPMLFFFYWFDLVKFMIALLTVVGTMSFISILGVELSLHRK